MVVYLDILFLTNLILNYIMLIITSSFLGVYTKRYRIFLAALVGAVYSVLIFFTKFLFLYSFIFKILMGILLAFISFGKKDLLKTSSLLFITSFIFAGASIGIYFLFKSDNFLVYNGVPYFDISLNILISTFILCYLFLCILHSNLFKHKILHNNLTTIYIENNGTREKISVFLDTGNNLTDIITNKPIIIVQNEQLVNLIPKELHFILKENPVEALSFSTKYKNKLKLRLVNYSTLSNENAIMLVFSPKTIYNEKRQKIDALIGISLEKINISGAKAIMGV